MIKISASLLSARNNLLENIKEFNGLNIDYIHLDIMDGKFVANTSFTEDEINIITNNTVKKLDVHLMVENPQDYIDRYNLDSVEFITIHYETMKSLDVINKIKFLNKKVGISIKPNTNIKEIIPILKYLDLVLLMSVEPGKGGQTFIDNTLNKIFTLSNYIKENNLTVLLSVDGGINEKNYRKCIEKGSNILVVGSSLVYTNNKNKYINILKGIDL